MDHRVEPPSWLPQGAAPNDADPEADEAPASDDAHALQDDSAEADSTAEEFPNGNGHDGPYTYLRDDSQIYNQDSPYAGGQDSPYSGRAPFEEPTRPPFDELPGASFDQPAAPAPPGDELAGSTFGSGVTVGRAESGFSGSAESADVPDGGFGGSTPGGASDGGYGGGGFAGSGFTGSAFTGSSFTGSPAGADLHDGGFTGGVAGPGGLAGSGPAGGDPYTAQYSPGYSESPVPTVATGPETASQTAQRTGTYAYPPPQPGPVSPPAPPKGKQSASSARRANLIVARLEPWSVMKFSFLISLVAWIVLFVAVALIYYALSSLGVFASLQKTLASVTASQGSAGVDLSKWTSGTRVMGYTMLLGAVDVVLITALSTLGAVVYNLVTHLGGGIEITLKETE